MTRPSSSSGRPSAGPPRAVPTLAVHAEVASDTAVPRLPTTVVSSWKGGVWKTAISASLAERLAFAGLDVLYLVTDDQLDARRRLGISESDPDVAGVQRGPGSITVVGLAGAHAMDVLYRSGPSRFGRFDAIVVDTPPVKKGGCLPGVLLIAPTDGGRRRRREGGGSRDSQRRARQSVRRRPSPGPEPADRAGARVRRLRQPDPDAPGDAHEH